MQATTESVEQHSSPAARNVSFTYKLARHLFRLPSRVLSRMRHLDGVLDQPLGQPSPDGARSGLESQGSAHHQRVRESSVTPLPGPWGFLTSGYFFGLFFMAFLLNRVQNLVVPPRQTGPYYRQIRSLERRFGRRYWTRLLRSLLPVDLSSTRSRLLLRIPSIYLLLKSLTLWTIILLQTSNRFPSSANAVITNLGQWAAQRPTDDVCWSTFISVCVALFVASLTSGMEAFNATGNTPFNLFGYSFVLYVYGSPMTHVNKVRGVASRPDVHVIITIMLPLLQLTMIHCLEVKQKWGRMRLIPTTIVGVISLVHFHLVVWCFPSLYPLPNIVPNFIESFLLFVTTVTFALNALAQLLMYGTITKPLVGHAATLMPKWDEDFSVVLFRLGMASLEATSVAGFGHEVGNIVQGAGDITHAPLQPDHSIVEITRAGVVSLVHGKNARPHRGFANEVKNVRVSSRNSHAWLDALVNTPWSRELWQFLQQMWKVFCGSMRMLLALVRGRWKQAQLDRHRHAGEKSEKELVADTDAVAGADPDVQRDVYERLLRGDEMSDDDEDFQPDGSSPDTPSATSESEDEDEEHELDADAEEDGDDGASDALVLYADLSATASSSSTAPLFLAHMTNPTGSPLTRQRYSRFMAGALGVPSSQIDDWGAFVLERREAKRGLVQDANSQESRRHCVICTVEPRDIICWPCRCLALCDDCRENLASRSAASKHLCPCCRRPVEGFSKIYIP